MIFITSSKSAWNFSFFWTKPLKTLNLPQLFICSMACTWLYWPLAERCLQRCLLAYWKMCLLPLAQPSGNNITHTERSWCQGQLSCKRWGRWETCIDFSFCWGKQACCGWARMQWGRQNVLDCFSSLLLVSCDCWKTPCTHRHTHMYRYICFQVKMFRNVRATTHWNVIFKEERATEENFG